MLSRTISSYLVAWCFLALFIEPAIVGSEPQTGEIRERTGEVHLSVPKLSNPLPFGPGEQLTYDIGFSKLILSGSIGQLKLAVKEGPPIDTKGPAPTAKPSTAEKKKKESNKAGAEPRPDTQVSQPPGSEETAAHAGNLEFSAEVVSKGFFTWLFGIKIEDRYGAIVSSDDFGLLRSWKELDQGDLHQRNETKVDRGLGAISYSETDRKTQAPAKVKTSNSPSWVLDLLSAVYFIRTQELKEGKTITMPITDVGQVYMIDAVPVKREDVEVGAGKFRSIQLDLKIFDGKYIKRSGQLLVWLSDDARRLPIRARLKSSGTTVNITLVRQVRLG
jgi:hypothetical protein